MVEEFVSEDLSCGLRASQDERSPPGLGLKWIAWDSAFRGTGLRVGDRIVAVDGQPLDPASEDVRYTHHVGAAGEYNRWKKRGAHEGQPVALTVRRKGRDLDFTAELRAARSWRNEAGRRLLAPDGPDVLSNEGFIGGWGGWYDKLVERLSITLDNTWRHRIDNRGDLQAILQYKPRIDHLLSHYPGRFATTVAADFAAAVECLEGRVYDVPAQTLAHRDLGPQRAGGIKEAARAKKAEFMAAHAAELIPPFPAVDAMSISARDTVANKMVALPTMGRGSQWQEAHRHWFVSGDDRQGYYFVDAQSEAMERAFDADWRYMKLIDPKPKYEYTIIGRIAGVPKMIVHDGRAYTGLLVEPMAVTVGSDTLFVDLTQQDEGISRYAGEPIAPLEVHLPSDLSPRALIECFFEALKQGDQQTWGACYATWQIRNYGPGRILYAAQAPVFGVSHEREWVRAREMILGPVYDVRVVDEDEPELVLGPEMLAGAPRIEQVVVEVDHIGLIDGVHRAFLNMKTHRLWPVQRRDGGPWRIADADYGI